MAVFSIFLSCAFSWAYKGTFLINRITDLSAVEGTDLALHIDFPAAMFTFLRFSHTPLPQKNLENSIIDSRKN
jgi:hypothetical protein